MQHVTPVHVSSRIHTAESGKAGNDRAWSHSKNKSVMSEKKEKHYNASIHIYVQLISVM